MTKYFLAIAALLALVATTAEARGRRGSCCCDGAPVAVAPADQAPQVPTPPAQARRPDASRSFSYEPQTYSYEPGTYVAPIGGDYGLEPYYNTPRASFGLRPASSKANANY